MALSSAKSQVVVALPRARVSREGHASLRLRFVPLMQQGYNSSQQGSAKTYSPCKRATSARWRATGCYQRRCGGESARAQVTPARRIDPFRPLSAMTFAAASKFPRQQVLTACFPLTLSRNYQRSVVFRVPVSAISLRIRRRRILKQRVQTNSHLLGRCRRNENVAANQLCNNGKQLISG